METWKFAFKSILSHKMRSLLTMVGIIIGIASVVTIVALGEGVRISLEGALGKGQEDVSIYFSNFSSNTEQNGVISFTTAEQTSTEEEPVLQDKTLQGLLTVPGVSNYYTTNSTIAEISFGNKKANNATITGVSRSYFAIKKYELLAGRSFTDTDYTKFARIIMLDKVLAEKLFGTADVALNQTVNVKGHAYLVVGVYKDPNSGTALYGANSDGNAVMTNTQLAAEEGVNENAQVYVHVENVATASDTGRAAAAYLTQATGLKEAKYDIYDLSAQLTEFNNQMSTFTIFIGAVAGISLLVGGIGVMNIMLVSVTERTREIGLRKALGATRGNILTQFLVESIVLTSLGGAIGLLLAQGLVALVNASQALGEGIAAIISLPVVIGSIVFSATVGIVFGVLPASKASKLDPIEALRYE